MSFWGNFDPFFNAFSVVSFLKRACNFLKRMKGNTRMAVLTTFPTDIFKEKSDPRSLGGPDFGYLGAEGNFLCATGRKVAHSGQCGMRKKKSVIKHRYKK